MEPHAVLTILKAMELEPDPVQARLVIDLGSSVARDALLLLARRCMDVDALIRHLHVLEGIPVDKQVAFLEQLFPDGPGNN